MYGIENYAAFIAAAIMLNMTPGIDTFYILGKSLAGGRKTGIISALGISTGVLVHTVMASLGLSLILAQSATAFNLVKWAGAAYLIIMGIKAILSASHISLAENQQEAGTLRIYTQGILTNVLNPKVALFFLAFLPQFVDPATSYGPLPFLLLGLTFFSTGTVWCCLLALLSSTISGYFRRSPASMSASGKIAGLIYIALGISILKTKMNN